MFKMAQHLEESSRILQRQ